MASISSDRNGNRTIQFVGNDGKRRSVRLGGMPIKSANEIKLRIEALVAAKFSALPVDAATASWLREIGDSLQGKLAGVGLVSPRQAEGAIAVPTLAAFIDGFLAGRDDLKPNTLRTFHATRVVLVKHFGGERSIDSITAGDADEWAAALRKDYSPASIATFVKRARQMFRHAARKRLLPESPFRETKVPSQVNKSREEFIDRATVAKLLDVAPDADWRCIIALASYAGLRTPSETLSLKWTDIDWERNRITVFSPKLEHLPSGGYRQIPLFPELLPILSEAFEAAPIGAVHVVGRYRDGKQNLRTQFLRIIRKAGLKPWGRLFHNLRGSRETELAQDFPVHVVAAWLGNTPKVAAAHYLQLRDSDFERAAKSGAPALQNAVQQASATLRTDSHDATEDQGESEFASNSQEMLEVSSIPDRDRTTHENQAKNATTPAARCKIRCSSSPETPIDLDLALILERWPTLPATVRARVMATIREALQGDGGDAA